MMRGRVVVNLTGTANLTHDVSRSSSSAAALSFLLLAFFMTGSQQARDKRRIHVVGVSPSHFFLRKRQIQQLAIPGQEFGARREREKRKEKVEGATELIHLPILGPIASLALALAKFSLSDTKCCPRSSWSSLLGQLIPTC